MNIKYKEKPSEDAIKNYKEKLERFLSAYKASITVDLWDNPLRMESKINGHETVEYFWVKDIKISTPEVENLSVSVLSDGVNENMTDQIIWLDAGNIQSQLYMHFGRHPKTPLPNDDPYWKLWDHLKDLKV